MVIYFDDRRGPNLARANKSCGRYGPKLPATNCTSTVVVSATFACQQGQELSPQWSEDSHSVDVEAFINRVYTFASRV